MGSESAFLFCIYGCMDVRNTTACIAGSDSNQTYRQFVRTPLSLSFGRLQLIQMNEMWAN